MGVRANDDSATPTRPSAAGRGSGPGTGREAAGPPAAPAPAGGPASGADAPDREAPATAPAADAGRTPDSGPAPDGQTPAPDAGPTDSAPDAGTAPEGARRAGGSRRPPTVTRDTARPEGGGRAAPGDAPAPARQWPLLTVLGLAALGLLVVGFDPFPQASRIGAMLIGVALLTGAVMRRVLPSVGMLAVRSRFTDMAAYGVLGLSIVLLSLMTQPRPWLEVPFLEDAVRFAVR
ncbi:DUF3017 domain-containing protein [Streptomyces sp. NPDC016309]|uniref:DUF3017 domain-containing protein n=1 Tax=Streptomyces sp. NPDC016309 TaxID=3364965 RepID=UPI0036FD3E51